MPRRKAARPAPPARRVTTGCYVLTDLAAVIRALVEDGCPAVLFVPAGWARASLPILSPAALRLVDIHVRRDVEFPLAGHFVAETGKLTFQWGARAHITQKVAAPA